MAKNIWDSVSSPVAPEQEAAPVAAAVAPPQAAPATPAVAPSQAAPVTPPPASPTGNIWDSVSSAAPAAPDAPAPPPEVEETPTYEQVVNHLNGMVRNRRPLADIMRYSEKNGITYTPEHQETLKSYEEYRRAHPHGTPGLNFEPIKTSGGGALARGASDILTIGGADELTAGASMLGNELGQVLGLAPKNDLSPGQLFNMFQREYVQRRAADEQQHGDARLVGQGVGFAGSLLYPAVSARQGANFLTRVGAGALTGAGYGAVGGALSSNDDRLGGAATGGLIGLGIGGGLPALGPLGRRLSLPFTERLLPGGENSGLNALARRVEMDPAAMAAEAQRLRDLGMEPALLDLMNAQGRRTVRAAATRNTPAAEATERFADARRVNLQDEVAGAADIIAPRTGSTQEIVDHVARGRNALADQQFEAVRKNPVPLTDRIVEVLQTGEGRTAVRQAMKLLQPADRVALRRMMGSVNTIAGIDPRLGAAARAQITAQVMRDTPFTVDMADKISRALLGNAAKGTNPGASRILDQFGRTIRDEAAGAVPAYQEALDNYGAQSRLIGASEVGDAFMAAGDATDYANRFGRLSADRVRQPAFDEHGNVNTQVRVRGPSEQDVARGAAANAVRTAASESPRGALLTADKLAIGGAQQQRNATVLGPTQADRLSAAMGGRARMVRDATFIDPKAGSKTSGVMADNAALEAMGDLAMAAATGGKTGILRALHIGLGRLGMKDIDAERLVMDSITPARTNDAISYLARRLNNKPLAREIVGRLRQAGAALSAEEANQPADRLIDPDVRRR